MFVTGCHRSGTSLLAGLLSDLRGNQARADDLEATIENPQGFFESRRLMELNDSLLESIGCGWNCVPIMPPSWSSPSLMPRFVELRSALASYALNRQWIDKDPRLCLTYPAYLHILLRRVPLVASLRQPIAVATSLYARNGLPLDAGLALWFVYNHHLCSVMQQGDLLVSYQNLLGLAEKNTRDATLSNFDGFLAVHDGSPPPMEVWDRVIQARVQPALNRSIDALPRAVADGIHGPLKSSAEEAYAHVVDCGTSLEAFLEAFAALPRPVLDALQRHDLTPQIGCYLERANQLEAELAASRQRCDHLQNQLDGIQSSTLWRWSAPLRHGLDRLRAS